MLKAIFYARFHPERGPSVIHQYPPNSIVVPSNATDRALLDFSDVSSYLIPPYEICNRAFSVCTNGHRLLGFPVSLENAEYSRNRFTFNVCFVLDDDVDAAPWEQIVRKTANFFKTIEEEDGILQAEELLDALRWAGEEGYPTNNTGVLYSLLKTVFEELNAYGEACARLSEVHVLNLRLVSAKEPAVKVRAWDVPLMVRGLPNADEWTWDLTLQRIHPHVDGVKHIQRIAELSDVDLKQVKLAVQELLYHELAVILDIFHFQAIYALTADFGWFVKDVKMQEECCAYIATNPDRNIFKSVHTATRGLPTSDKVVNLYRLLNPGTSLHEFCLTHESDLCNIDIRRFITFGVLKGFIRRIHKYALAIEPQSSTPQTRLSNSSTPSRAKSSEEAALDIEKAWKKAALSSGWPTPPMETLPEGVSKATVATREQAEQEEMLRKFLDGKHCLDEICVTLHVSEKKLVEKLRSGRFGEVVFFCQ